MGTLIVCVLAQWLPVGKVPDGERGMVDGQGVGRAAGAGRQGGGAEAVRAASATGCRRW